MKSKLKSKSFKNKIIFYLLIFTIIIITGFLFFNEYGILKYFKLVNEIDRLDEQIEKTEENIKQHNLEIDSLKSSDIKIEEVAREKYRMHRKNEKTLRIEEK
jgi:cell division protein FtsB